MALNQMWVSPSWNLRAMGKQVRNNPSMQDYTCVLTNHDMFPKRKRPRRSTNGQEGVTYTWCHIQLWKGILRMGQGGGDLHTVPFTAVEGDPEDGTFKLRPEGKEAAMEKVGAG